MEDIEKVLLSLKDQAIEATKRMDGDFYRNYLADSAVAVTPFGTFDKETIVKQMSGDSPFRSVGVEDTRVIVLTQGSGIVTYKALFESVTGEKRTFQVFVSTVYAKINGQWKGVFYQQTPMPPAQPIIPPDLAHKAAQGR